MRKRNMFFATVAILLVCSCVAVAASTSWSTTLPAARVRKDVATGRKSSSTDYVRSSLNTMGGEYTQVRARIWSATDSKWATGQVILDKGSGLRKMSFSDSSDYVNSNLTLSVSNNIVSTVAVDASGSFEYSP